MSKWPYWKLWNFALEGITSFSTVLLLGGLQLMAIGIVGEYVGWIW